MLIQKHVLFGPGLSAAAARTRLLRDIAHRLADRRKERAIVLQQVGALHALRKRGSERKEKRHEMKWKKESEIECKNEKGYQFGTKEASG